MTNQRGSSPFESLGNELKAWRERLKESRAEVSGAVEIDEDALRRIESGSERPSEDILMLLISHFNIQEEEAVSLWELAGYEYESDQNDESGSDVNAALKQLTKAQPTLMIMALDQRVLYSDGAEINANKNGVMLTFTQHNGQQDMPIAKIGMSYEHAKSVFEILGRTLAEAQRRQTPRQLPESVNGETPSSHSEDKKA